MGVSVDGLLPLRNMTAVSIGPQPVMNPCMTTPMTLETTQYRASPLGNCRLKKPNIRGIIQSIIRFVDSCLASAAGIVVIFCISHIDPPTSTGSTGVLSGRARSSQRKELSRGMTSWTIGSHE